HFSFYRAELLDHGVECFFKLHNSAVHVYGDLVRKVAGGDGSGDFGDVADLACEVAGHEIDIVGEVLPCASYARHLRLTAELAVSADLARHTRHLARESVELVNHSVDRILQFKNLAFHIHSDLSGHIATGHGGGHLRDVAHLPPEVSRHRVRRVSEVIPHTSYARHIGLTA